MSPERVKLARLCWSLKMEKDYDALTLEKY